MQRSAVLSTPLDELLSEKKLIVQTSNRMQSYSNYLGSLINKTFDKSAIKHCFYFPNSKRKQSTVLSKSTSASTFPSIILNNAKQVLSSFKGCKVIHLKDKKCISELKNNINELDVRKIK
jgi:hypothetical protein